MNELTIVKYENLKMMNLIVEYNKTFCYPRHRT